MRLLPTILSFFLLITPLVTAAPTTVEQPATTPAIDEAHITTTPLGSQIRLLQLHNAVTKAIIIGDETVAVLNDTTNTTYLSGIVANLTGIRSTIKQRIQSNNTIAPSEYIAWKELAQNQTASFKRVAQQALSPEQEAVIRSQAKPRISAANADRREQLQRLIDDYNEARYKDLAEKAGMTPEKTSKTPQERFKAQLRSLPDEARADTVTKLREDMVKQRIQIQSDEEALTKARKNAKNAVKKHRGRPKTPPGQAKISSASANADEHVKRTIEERREAITASVEKPGQNKAKNPGEQPGPSNGLGR